jgi:hypothetical protein
MPTSTCARIYRSSGGTERGLGNEVAGEDQGQSLQGPLT